MKYLLALISLVAVQPCLASVAECSFEHSCYSFHDMCTDSYRSVIVDWETGDTDANLLFTGAGEYPATVRNEPKNQNLSFVTAIEENTVHLLTIYESGAAVLTSHTALSSDSELAIAVTDIGNCEVTQ